MTDCIANCIETCTPDCNDLTCLTSMWCCLFDSCYAQSKPNSPQANTSTAARNRIARPAKDSLGGTTPAQLTDDEYAPEQPLINPS